jgi:Cu-Zn family superoxide dismutase
VRALAAASVLLLATTAACARPALRAAATLRPTAGHQVTGTATFTERDGATAIVLSVHRVAPGGHGVHVHETGDCSAPDASSAGDHFAGESGAHHGHPHHGHHHGGDLGNLEAGADGSGVLEVTTDTLTVAPGPRSVVGRAIIIHAAPDDPTVQPSGGSGARIGCGVIERVH